LTDRQSQCNFDFDFDLDEEKAKDLCVLKKNQFKLGGYQAHDHLSD
jgi:hypothetical protein